MFKFTILYYRVDDEAKLESFFSSTNVPLAERLPGLAEIEVSRIIGKPGGGGSRFHLAYSLYFATQESFQLAIGSEAGFRFVKALKPWADAGLIVWYFADVSEEIVKHAGPKVTVEDLLPNLVKKSEGDTQSASQLSPDDADGM
ncbi:MAG: EthD family reductase [Candidatus Promineifilaceae bacterium]